MPTLHLHQIFYSEETRDALDPGFIPLDNLANPRPDWREYWPIRNYLLGEDLVEGDFYGFFSPRFGIKTSLSAQEVEEFVRANPHADVVGFSPYFDQMAYFLNPFEQGEKKHRGLLPVVRDFLAAIGWDTGATELVADSRTAIFCNYFVARPRFWRAWLEVNERLFAIAEAGGDGLGGRMNVDTSYGGQRAPMKVFVMERTVSLLLLAQPGWRSVAFNPFGLMYLHPGLADYKPELLMLDALKTAYLLRGDGEFLDAFSRLRQLIRGAFEEAQKARL